MKWKIKTTLLSVVLPLSAAAAIMLVNTGADLLTTRADVSAFRGSVFRALHAEKFARQMQVLLEDSREIMQGTTGASERWESTHASINDTLLSLQELVEAPAGESREERFTVETLDAWADARQQIVRHLERGFQMLRSGQRDEAKRIIEADCELLLRARLRKFIDPAVALELSRIDRYSARLVRGTENGLLQSWIVAALPEKLRELAHGAMLMERFGRYATEEFRMYAHEFSNLKGSNNAESFGISHAGSEGAGRALAGLERLERRGVFDAESPFHRMAGELKELHLNLRSGYREVHGLSAAAGAREVSQAVSALTSFYVENFHPRLQALAAADQQFLNQEMEGLETRVNGILQSVGLLAGALLLLVISGVAAAFRWLVRPLAELVSMGWKYREGDTEARTSTKLHGEMLEVGESLNYLMAELQKSNLKIRDLAFYDSATGLPNRELFQERVGATLVKASLEGQRAGLLVIGFDELKQVNQTLGETAGDELLGHAAERLRGCFDLVDDDVAPGATGSAVMLARLGGGSFAVLLAQQTDVESLSLAAEQILTALGAPCVVMNREIAASLSIGIAIYPDDGDDGETLLRSATAACEHARARGRGGHLFYSKAMNALAMRKLHIRSRLSGALERGDLVLHYQPVRDAQEGHLTGAEALLRWTDKEMGPVTPSEFIPVAEETGLITSIGRWVVSEACSQARRWQDAGFREIRMAVNVSAAQLRDSAWAETVLETLRSTGLDPAHLDIEITETAILQDDPVTDANLARLQEIGVGIALDDFGMGYSSLSLLRRFRFTRLKIDRSFVSEIYESGEGDDSLTGAILAMAHSLGLPVVAEGVETSKQANFLRSRGCEELQGYLLGRAVAPSSFEKYLDRNKPDE
jgi:diguanylate cyclase (GGDEF)-like protein